MLQVLLLLGLIVALYIAWSIGANDETMANLAGSRFVSVTTAVMLGAIMDFLGAVTLGYKVEETISKDLLNYEVTEADALVIVVSVALWLTVASSYGWPISTTHSVVGACIGLGLVKLGIAAVNWNTFVKILLAWILSPFIGLVFTIMTIKVLGNLINRYAKGLIVKVRITYLAAYLLLVWSCISAFSRGANDIANATAFLSMIYGNSLVIRLLCGLGMSLGLITIGRRVVKSVGFSLSNLNPFTALTVQISVALTMFVGTWAKLPLSGTHILVGSIIGVGIAKGTWLNIGNIKKIVVTWILTFPATLILAGLFSILIG